MLAWNINEVHLSFSWCWSLEKAVLPWTGPKEGDWKQNGSEFVTLHGSDLLGHWWARPLLLYAVQKPLCSYVNFRSLVCLQKKKKSSFLTQFG